MVKEATLIDDLSNMIVNILIRTGMDADQAKFIRDREIEVLLKSQGGKRHYLPSHRKVRREQITQGWKSGRSIRQLAMDFDVSERCVYAIVAGM